MHARVAESWRLSIRHFAPHWPDWACGMYQWNDIASTSSAGVTGSARGARERDCLNCKIRHEAICAPLDDCGLMELQRLGKRRTLHKGQALSWEGDEAPLVVNVLSGMLKLS